MESASIVKRQQAASCTRCGGLLVEEFCMDLSNSERTAEAQRCVQCGELVDPVILANRTRRPAGTPSSNTNRISLPHHIVRRTL